MLVFKQFRGCAVQVAGGHLLPPRKQGSKVGRVDETVLIYVGITRARQTLALTWCGHRIKYGSPMPGTASSFLKELPADWVEHKNATQMLNAPVAAETVKGKFGALRALLENTPS